MRKIAWAPLAGVAAMVSVGIAVGLALGGGALAQAQEGPDGAQAFKSSPADVARGRAIFAGTCGAYCHKMTDTHGGDAPFLFGCDLPLAKTDQMMFHTISHGVAGTRMVAFGGAIPDDDIWRIVAYLKTNSQCKAGG
jgi:mono/diheme cytochrome c family protein